ncbi:MAG: SUMF1/EgtB/PvdO family nonheme iron enzyme, partial [Hyphomicrobiaceae bacterium]
MSKVFISYRRDDSRYQARMIYTAFRQVLPRESVFMDVDSVPPGADFVDILEGWVDECNILLALIGPGWIAATDPKTGRPRLVNPNDFVRIEIRKALVRGIPVVPVLLDGTPMPDADLLPDDMRKLVRRHAEFVEFRTFDTDVERLIKKLGLGRESTAFKPAYPAPGSGKTEWFKDIEVGPEMVVVPAGEFSMGSPENEPEREGNESRQNPVTIARPFAVGRFAVTRAEFAAFVKAKDYQMPDEAWTWEEGKWELRKGRSWRNPALAQDDR